MKIKGWWMSMSDSQRTLVIMVFAFMTFTCVLGLDPFISYVAKDPVERAAEQMWNAEEWRHLRWSRGASEAELRALDERIKEAALRYSEALEKRHRKGRREATEARETSK